MWGYIFLLKIRALKVLYLNLTVEVKACRLRNEKTNPSERAAHRVRFEPTQSAKSSAKRAYVKFSICFQPPRTQSDFSARSRFLFYIQERA